MYGTRAATDGWHSECASTLVDDLEFSIGNASARVFFHERRKLMCSVHDDDLTATAPKDQANSHLFVSKMLKNLKFSLCQKF